MEGQYLVGGNKGVSFSEFGDSGSPVLYQNVGLGMVIANAETILDKNGVPVPGGSTSYTVVTPFEDLVKSLNTSLSTASGTTAGSNLGTLALYQGAAIPIFPP
jgi:hypothetical protein